MNRMVKMFNWRVLLLVLLCGCGSAGQESYVPSESTGRQALESALAAWQSGKPMDRVEVAGGPAAQPQDSDWKSGKKLANFSVEKELPTTEGPKQFAVRLTFQGETKPVDAVYFVVGRDPLWVFRDRDYQKATGM
jgi:hypothetical protein